MLDVAEYSSASECRFSDIRTTWRRKKCKNKARFSDEQIRSLEVTFETETKLEPRKKALLAKELGLQPRQVAIWFQNKRARWKSKQMEKEYGILLASYNTLASQVECLKKERQSLLVQLQSLKNEMEKSADKSLGETQENAANSSRNVESDNTKKNEFKPKDNNNISTRRDVGMLLGDDDVSVKSEYMALHDEELLKLVESHNESPLTSSDDWGTSLDSDDHQWWDFWC